MDRWIAGLGRRELLTILLLAVEVVLFSLLTDNFLTASNLFSVLRNSAEVALVAIGMTIVMILGGIDISVGSALGVAAILVSRVVLAQGHPLVAVAVGLSAGLLIGAVNGLLVSKARIVPIIATLGTMYILRAAVFGMLGGQWITGLAPIVPAVTASTVFGLPSAFVFVLVFYAGFWYVLTYTRFGRYVHQVGNNPEAAQLAGINANQVRIISFALLGALTGVASILYVSRMGGVEITVGATLPIRAIAASVVGGVAVTGGRGTLVGTLAGVLFIDTMRNGIVLLGVPSLWEQFVVGVLIVVAVALDLAFEKREERRRVLERFRLRTARVGGPL